MLIHLSHNPYFNRWFSAIMKNNLFEIVVFKVTILILIDGFLQWLTNAEKKELYTSHNPYFNRWFSAITKK